MGNLLTSLLNSTGALRAYSQALQVVQNNVTNASTPGYVKQVQTFQSLPFDVSVGLPGGVTAGQVTNTRDAFAEQNVRNHQSALGLNQQKTSLLNGVEANFDVSGKSGLPPAINALFQSFSRLSINPSDPASRQGVLDAAHQLAQTFHTAASNLGAESQAIDQQTRGTVGEINRIATTISHINSERSSDPHGGLDPGLDAQLNSSLEELSQYGDFTALQQPDGKVNLYLGGQTPIVVASQSFAVQADFSNPQTKILDAGGQDITSQITQGTLRAQLDVKNNLVPSYTASLDTLAKNVADQVNTALSQGVDANGNAPATGLFAYGPVTGAALSITVNALSPDGIAAASPSAPGGNGNALILANLGNTKAISGQTYAEFYGALAGRVGGDLVAASDTQDTQRQLLTQAQNLRQQSSGVSLDEEATRLIEFQRAYQATSKMIGVLNDLTQTAIDIIR